MKTDNELLVLGIYVDDGLIISTSEILGDFVIEHLKKNFEITQSDNVKCYVGLEIEQFSDAIFICQTRYIEAVVKRFEIDTEKVVNVPYDRNSLSISDYEPGSPILGECDKPYRELLGCLIYLSNCSRPDITFIVIKLSRFIKDARWLHWKAAIKVLMYLSTTKNLGILYKSGDMNLIAFSDSDFASDVDTRKSTSGNVFTLGGAAISWQSKLQNCVAVSTAEAEFVAAALAVRNLIWLKNFIFEIISEELNITLYVDNQSAIKMIENPVMHNRTKHIDIQYHFIRDIFQKGLFNLKYIPSKAQLFLLNLC